MSRSSSREGQVASPTRVRASPRSWSRRSAHADADAIAEDERHRSVAEHALRHSRELVHAELVVRVLVRQLDDGKAEAAREPDDAVGVAFLDGVQQHLATEGEAAARAHALEVLVL